VTDDGGVGVIAAGGKVLALREAEGVEHGREAALVELVQGVGEAGSVFVAFAARVGRGGHGVGLD